MHQPKILFNTKIYQPKIKMQSRIKNSPNESICVCVYIYIYIYIYIWERERESLHLFVWAKFGLNRRKNSKI